MTAPICTCPGLDAPHPQGITPGCMAETPDPVNHPAHYTSHPARCECGRPVECIQITEHMTFCVGNAIKYLWRAGLKGDDAVQDLRKAAWYATREAVRLERLAREA